MTGEQKIRVVRVVAASGMALAVAGILCRGRDGSMVTAVIYYATPWLPRLLTALFAFVVFRHGVVRALAGACAILSLGEGWRSFRLDELPPAPAEALRVSVFNAGRALDRRTAAWTAMGEADISAAIECGTFSADEWQRFIATEPELEWRRFDTSTMLGVRGKILNHESLGVHDKFRCHRVRVSLRTHGELTVVVGDVRSQPWISREQALATMLRAAGDDPRAIILGDFNTPPESGWYREWRRKGFILANAAPRRGFRETWAYGLPLLTLDHIWLGSGWRATRVDQTFHGSDHRRVKATLAPAAD